MSLIQTLAPLGRDYTIAFTLAYGKDAATATATIYLKPTEEAKHATAKNLQLAGTPEEVDKTILEQLPTSVKTILAHNQTLAEQIATQIEADKAEAAAEKAKKTPAPKPAPTPAPKAATKTKKGDAAKSEKPPVAETDGEETDEDEIPATPADDKAPKRPLSAAEQAVLALNTPDEGTL